MALFGRTRIGTTDLLNPYERGIAQRGFEQFMGNIYSGQDPLLRGATAATMEAMTGSLDPTRNQALMDYIAQLQSPEATQYQRSVLRSQMGARGMGFGTPAVRTEIAGVDAPLQAQIQGLLGQEYGALRGLQSQAAQFAPALASFPMDALAQYIASLAGGRQPFMQQQPGLLSQLGPIISGAANLWQTYQQRQAQQTTK